MLSVRVKLQLAAFVLLSGGVAANLFFLQPRARGPGSAPPLDQTAALERAGFGATGSIARTGEGAGEAGRSPQKHAAALAIPHDSADLTRAVQRELQVRGYEMGAADGVAGLMTRAAIMGFEHDHGLPLTGQPSQALLKRIVLGGPATASQRIGSQGQSAQAADIIRSVQNSLARLGYRPGAIDGRLSPATVRAIREFEVDQSLPESGRIGGPLAARLARLAGEGRVALSR